MHHHEAHEPNYDVTLPPDMTQSIWESMGWGPNSSNPLNVDIGDGDSEDSNGDSSSDEDPSRARQGAGVEMHDECDRVLLNPALPSLEFDPSEYQRRMRRHIALIRDFCDGLEYQLPFNDYRMLEALEREGGRFLRLVEDCLGKEGRLKVGPVDEPQEDDPAGKSVTTS